MAAVFIMGVLLQPVSHDDLVRSSLRFCSKPWGYLYYYILDYVARISFHQECNYDSLFCTLQALFVKLRVSICPSVVTALFGLSVGLVAMDLRGWPHSALSPQFLQWPSPTPYLPLPPFNFVWAKALKMERNFVYAYLTLKFRLLLSFFYFKMQMVRY